MWSELIFEAIYIYFFCDNLYFSQLFNRDKTKRKNFGIVCFRENLKKNKKY